MKNLNRIYRQMGDELSRSLFLDRLDHSVSDNPAYIEKILDSTVRNSRQWKEFCCTMDRIRASEPVLFGAGIWGETLLSEFKTYPWKCIIDNSPSSTEKGGMEIIVADDFLKGYSGEAIVISSHKHGTSMIEQCKQAGVPESAIIDAGSVIYELTEGKIYLDTDVPLEIKNGLFVDGGCFDGSDAERFMDSFSGKVICFEPDSKNGEKIRKRLAAREERYRLVCKALWSGETTLSFSSGEDCGSHITEDETAECVQATAIDLEAGAEPVSFIKMDIEGAELEALKGAQNTIRRDHPTLAISVYHKPEDIISIPSYILSLYEGYRLYLRHYSFSWYDTVLYAIPGEVKR